MAKAVGLPQNSYCLFAKVRASLPDSTNCRTYRRFRVLVKGAT